VETLRKAVEEHLTQLLAILEEDVTMTVEEDVQEGVYVNLEGNPFTLSEDRSVLTALEHLVRGAIRRKTGSELEIVIDINGAVKRRRADLIRFALTKGEEVRSEHKRIRLNPMPSHERRTVHVTLANFPGVKTYSTGEGDNRRVIIEPEDAQ